MECPHRVKPEFQPSSKKRLFLLDQQAVRAHRLFIRPCPQVALSSTGRCRHPDPIQRHRFRHAFHLEFAGIVEETSESADLETGLFVPAAAFPPLTTPQGNRQRPSLEPPLTPKAWTRTVCRAQTASTECAPPMTAITSTLPASSTSFGKSVFRCALGTLALLAASVLPASAAALPDRITALLAVACDAPYSDPQRFRSALGDIKIISHTVNNMGDTPGRTKTVLLDADGNQIQISALFPAGRLRRIGIEISDPVPRLSVNADHMCRVTEVRDIVYTPTGIADAVRVLSIRPSQSAKTRAVSRSG